MYAEHGNHFGHTKWHSYVIWVEWKLVLGHLEILLILMQDRCTVYVERSAGSEIILDTRDYTPR
jgi:hypothetical protein